MILFNQQLLVIELLTNFGLAHEHHFDDAANHNEWTNDKHWLNANLLQSRLFSCFVLSCPFFSFLNSPSIIPIPIIFWSFLRWSCHEQIEIGCQIWRNGFEDHGESEDGEASLHPSHCRFENKNFEEDHHELDDVLVHCYFNGSFDSFSLFKCAVSKSEINEKTVRDSSRWMSQCFLMEERKWECNRHR